MSTDPVIVGQREVSEKKPKRRYRRNEGWTTIKTYEGPRDAIDALSLELEKDGGADELLIDVSEPKARLEATYSDRSDSTSQPSESGTQIVWEADATEEQVALRLHPNFSTLDSAKADTIEQAVRNGTGSTLTGLTTLEQKYLTLLSRGTTHYGAQSYVLTKTTTTGWRSKVEASWTGVGKVTTNPFEGQPVNPNSFVSGGVKMPLPAGEWLKRAPKIALAGRKFRIVETWWWAPKWSAILYEGGTGDP